MISKTQAVVGSVWMFHLPHHVTDAYVVEVVTSDVYTRRPLKEDEFVVRVLTTNGHFRKTIQPGDVFALELGMTYVVTPVMHP